MTKNELESLYAKRAQRMNGSAIRELLKLTEQPDFISFAGGLPAPEVFPTAEVNRVVNDIMTHQGAAALQYGLTEGYTPLRELIASRMSRDGLQLSASNVMITTGSQQGLDLLGKLFLNPGDKVMVESPTYLGALQAWNAYEPNFLVVPQDEVGIVTGAMEFLLLAGEGQKLKFGYVLPNFQNPTGRTLPLSRRQHLIKLARQHNVLIVEDDPYGELRFEGERLPSLLELAGKAEDSAEYNGNILYLGTFSKTLAPGLRLGWIVAPAELISKLSLVKQGVDLNTSNFNQMIAYEMLKSGFIDHHVEYIREVYGERRNTMLAMMEKHFPEGIQWTKPQGGMFTWATLPENWNSTELLKQALEYRVAFVPGASFHALSKKKGASEGKNTLRLNFSNAKPAQIETGIAALGKLFHSQVRTSYRTLAATNA